MATTPLGDLQSQCRGSPRERCRAEGPSSPALSPCSPPASRAGCVVSEHGALPLGSRQASVANVTEETLRQQRAVRATFLSTALLETVSFPWDTATV